MRQIVLVVVGIIVLGGAAFLIFSALGEEESNSSSSSLISDEYELPNLGFQTVEDDYDWQFPADYAAHNRFQQEIWQLQTDNTCDNDLTIEYRILNLIPEQFAPDRGSDWSVESVMTAQFLIDDEVELVSDSRIAQDLAGATQDRLWIETWELLWDEQRFVIDTVDVNASFNLELVEPDIQDVTTWYRYQRSGSISGQYTSDDQVIDIDCDVLLIHQFGTPSEEG